MYKVWEKYDIGNVSVGKWQGKKMWNLKVALCRAEFFVWNSELFHLVVICKNCFLPSSLSAGSGTNCIDILRFSASFGAFIIDISISLPFPAICKLIFLILILQRMSRCVYELKNKSLDFGPSHLGYILFRKMTTCFGLRDCHQAIITKILKVRCSALQIKLVICEPMWLTEFI